MLGPHTHIGESQYGNSSETNAGQSEFLSLLSGPPRNPQSHSSVCSNERRAILVLADTRDFLQPHSEAFGLATRPD